MENEGSFSARVFTSNAVIPVADAYVSVVKPGTDGKEELIAFLKSKRNGLTRSVMLDAPNRENSLTSEADGANFSVYNMRIYQPLYYSTEVKNAQIFDGIATTLPFELIPLPEDENPSSYVGRVDVLPQNL